MVTWSTLVSKTKICALRELTRYQGRIFQSVWKDECVLTILDMCVSDSPHPSVGKMHTLRLS